MASTACEAYFRRIERKYGLTKDQFLELLVAQESKCPICDRELVLFCSERAKMPVVDHCHATGDVRGLLCNTCNITVGFLEKDEYRTYAALAYLGNPQDEYPGLRARAERREAATVKVRCGRGPLREAVNRLNDLLTGPGPGGILNTRGK